MELISPSIYNLIIFVLAIYVGYHVVWNVTPALHTPLMAVTNAISAIVIVGAMLAAALTVTPLGKAMGTLAVALAAVNVFGGFLVTRRMLETRQQSQPVALPQAAVAAHVLQVQAGDAMAGPVTPQVTVTIARTANAVGEHDQRHLPARHRRRQEQPHRHATRACVIVPFPSPAR